MGADQGHAVGEPGARCPRGVVPHGGGVGEGARKISQFDDVLARREGQTLKQLRLLGCMQACACVAAEGSRPWSTSARLDTALGQRR